MRARVVVVQASPSGSDKRKRIEDVVRRVQMQVLRALVVAMGVVVGR